MENMVLLSIVVIIALGIFSQWLAWRIQWPSIVIMSIAGLIIGPVFLLVNPEQALGDLYSPIVSLAVAVVLYEGSSSLDIREVKNISKSVFRVVTLGAFLAWVAGAVAAHYIAGLSWAVSFVIGGLFIVTGPTVIIPLLRQAKLDPRVAAVLKWEGIIIDPIGPLLALFAYEVIKVIGSAEAGLGYLLTFFLGALVAGLIGYVLGILVSVLAGKGLFPEYLKSPIILSFVLLCFSLGEMIEHETGMLSVTVMGLTIARKQKYVSSIGNIGHFIENISVILTSTIFILLTSSLSRETIGQIFTLPILGYVAIMLFVVRPLSIWLSTIGTELTNKEKTLIGWIAPRGIVALTVSSYFASILLKDGFEDAAILTALTFALVFITVCAHGFSLGPLAKKLDLASNDAPGVLLVGASEFSFALAKHLRKMDIPVLIIDHTFHHYIKAQEYDIDVYYGEILSEHMKYEVDLTPYEYILSLTEDPAYNALVCQSFIPEFGYQHTFTLPSKGRGAEQKDIPSAHKPNILFGEDEEFEGLNRKIKEGYTFHTVDLEVEEKQTMNKEDLSVPVEGTWLFIRRENEELTFVTLKEKITVEQGDQLVVLSKDKTD
ncbi:sodium:proton antiporter [Virgibacillus sp. MSP4-1]|uniref:cation:proton antiporter n=1 Tax=Virgibacillus sp. MSP4-1 TaxID=2700081 RepID=UPI00039FCB99|nr:sodium:proton antiporter [Virgibacillus sp. MSP4-1]QHS23720.1 sodium:proton antiporter [Virgibacillus sp. MSP4-1]